MSSKYKESGVDIDAAMEAGGRIGKLVRGTWGSEVLSEVGNFGGLFELPAGMDRPVLVSSTDGVGTKLKIAVMAGRHGSIGRCLVNHCVNDILVQGARPLVFLDYYACGKLDPEVLVSVVEGLACGCRENGCALIGGETAEMPGFYGEQEYDLAGTIVGVVEREEIIDGSGIRAGDGIWGFPSSGLHTNGFSLARRIVFEDAGLAPGDELPGTGASVADALLAVHRSYLSEIETLRGRIEIRGLAHITGGGFLDNIPRILPKGCAVEIDIGAWEVPPLFRFLRERGGVSRDEMYRVFNMGIGMAVVLPGGCDSDIGVDGYRWNPVRIGTVVEGDSTVKLSGEG